MTSSSWCSGVDPDHEARSLTAQMEKNGFVELRRVRGQNFTALGFGNRRDVPLKVRVVTKRGIELALDPEPSTALAPGVRYELLEAPIRGTQDADGDGFEEVFVSVQRERAAACVTVYRVRDSGFVDPVDDFAMPAAAASSRALRGSALCAPAASNAPETERAAPSDPGAQPKPAPDSPTSGAAP